MKLFKLYLAMLLRDMVTNKKFLKQSLRLPEITWHVRGSLSDHFRHVLYLTSEVLR